MENTARLSFCALGLMALFTGCSGGSGSAQPPAPAGPSVYVAGAYNDGAKDIPCYWKDGVRTDLPGNKGIARAIFVDTDGTVYTAGEYYLGSMSVACYWKGTTLNDLPDPGYGNSTARGIWVDNGVVYTSGRYLFNVSAHRPCYWVGTGNAQGLSNNVPMTDGIANAITVSKGDYFIGGEQSNGTRMVAQGWRVFQSGGIGITDLKDNGGNSSAKSVSIYNDQVYFGGQDGTDACSWKSADRYAIAYDATCNSIFVAGGLVYGAGHNQNAPLGPCTWKINGGSQRTALSHGNDPIHNADDARAIFVSQGVVYAAGHSFDAGLNNYRACYWTGPNRTDLSVGAGASSGFAVFVK